MTARAGLVGCPFCGSELGAGVVRCPACGATSVAQTSYGDDEPRGVTRGPRVAINRRTSTDEPLVVWRERDDSGTGQDGHSAAADDPGLTFDPIKVGPDTCSGCETSAVLVVDGQAALYSLEGCDDDWCYYENPQGIA